MNKVIIFRQTVNVMASSILIYSFGQVGVYFDGNDLSIFDVVIVVISFMGLFKINDMLVEYENNRK
ncbi:MAG: hypothetical protein ACRDD5_06295 [Silvania sp.]|uniref:hypothetical protein n=1 Tax=Silvania sp. TaxID=3016633 RepID=UPI003EE50C3B